ncbi:MAG: cytochrome P460 family protein [Betaproteobacteria bacterium]|nr:cytochrome P460 family protein [Betaproteobacteria bacterium]
MTALVWLLCSWRIMKTITLTALLITAAFPAAETEIPPAPTVDRVGFPKDYAEKFQVLRSVNRAEKQQVVTVYGNRPAASITRTNDLPYPYGSIIVMETADAAKDAQDKPLVDDQGRFRKEKVTGLHVMRREKGFGEAYRQNRTGEWEYVEYRPDGSYITPPQKSATCAECHVKAGAQKDFVYRARLGNGAGK